jgi:hypothetical protein
MKGPQMKRIALALTMTAAFGMGHLACAEDAKMVPLDIELPKPLFEGTPVPVKLRNMEPARKGKRPPMMVPEGLANLSKGKTVTSSDMEPVIGDLELVTDGDKSGEEGTYVELGPNTQWVQVDLGQASEIFAIVVWHYHSQSRAYHDVVAQVSDDADFLSNVQTVFNSDDDNSSGLGIGKDMGYMEDYQGKLIDAKGVKGRYVRVYSAGNTSNRMNHYVEVEVWGRAAK